MLISPYLFRFRDQARACHILGSNFTVVDIFTGFEHAQKVYTKQVALYFIDNFQITGFEKLLLQ